MLHFFLQLSSQLRVIPDSLNMSKVNVDHSSGKALSKVFQFWFDSR